MQYLKLKKDLYLVEQEIVKQKKKEIPNKINHIWIYDRSGSMWGELSKLTNDLIIKSKEINKGDTLTLGWFSGEGEFNFIVKGFKISEDCDYLSLEKIIKKNNTTLSTTCFSEILAESKNVIEDLAAFSDIYSLMFFTDGYPVVNNYQKEIKAIFKAIADLNGKLTSSCLIGYGYGYNKELMSEMAENLGGALIHNDDLEQFNITLSDIIKNMGEVDNRITVDLNTPSDLGLTFSIFDKNVNIYKQNEDNQIKYLPNKSAKIKEYIYTLTTHLSGNEEEIILEENELLRPTKKEHFLKAIYASAYLLSQKTKSDQAMEVLAAIGDVFSIDQLANAFTNKEYCSAEEYLRKAMNYPKSRFKLGINKKYLPKEDAFCILDLIEILMNDDKAYFYPYHKKFNYTRIGVATKQIGDYPKFEPEDLVKCPLSDLSWHKSKLNLSLRATINGTIKLKGDFKKVRLNETYYTHIYRNYTLVKDGMLNMDQLPVSVSEDTFNVLKEHNLIEEETYKENDIVLVNLKQLPIMNRILAKGKTSAKELSKKVFREIELQAIMKVFKAEINTLAEEINMVDKSFANLTDDQIKLLELNGITKNGFSPETEKEKPTDYYYAKDFEIKVKSFSSLPKISDVQTKIASGKKLTASDEVIKKALALLDDKYSSLSKKVKVSWLDEKINSYKKELVSLRTDIQKTKFAIILGKKWFDEFTNREESTITLEDKIFNFIVTEEIVYY